jgi:hypothetical protein
VEARFEGDLVLPPSDNNLVLPAPSPTLIPARDATGSPGEFRLYLQNNFTAKEFSENYEAHERGLPLPHRVTGTITVQDDRDNGVVDSWTVSLTGRPIQPHETRGSVWVQVPDHITHGPGLRSLEYELLPPRRRTYWVSRQDQVQLPNPAFAQRTGWWGRVLGR